MRATTGAAKRGSSTPPRRRLAGLVVLVVPLLVVTVFAVAEGVGGEEGWWGHLIQLAVLGGLAWLAWRWPRTGGLLLLAAGVVLGSWTLVQSAAEGTPNLGGVVLLAIPMAVAGGLFASADVGSRNARTRP